MTTTSGGGVDSGYLIAAKALNIYSYTLVLLNGLTSELHGALAETNFMSTNAQPTGLEDVAVPNNAQIISQLNLSQTLKQAWASIPSAGIQPTVTSTTVRIFNRVTGKTFTFTETSAKS